MYGALVGMYVARFWGATITLPQEIQQFFTTTDFAGEWHGVCQEAPGPQRPLGHASCKDSQARMSLTSAAAHGAQLHAADPAPRSMLQLSLWALCR